MIPRIAVVALGVILFVTPFVFGETTQNVAAYTAYVLGVLIALAGILNAAMKRVVEPGQVHVHRLQTREGVRL